MYNGRFDPERELDLLARYEVSVFCAPPTEYRLLVKQDLVALAAAAAAPLHRRRRAAQPRGDPRLARRLRAPRSTTATDRPRASSSPPTCPALPIRPGSMGKPFPGPRPRASSTTTAPSCPPGEVGDLALRGRPPSLFREYWKNPEETAACRRGEWYLTGDRARRDEDGYLWFVGRADDVIISAGYRIGPFEVESALLEHPAVVESAVVASPDADARRDREGVRRAARRACAGRRAGRSALQEHVKRVTAPVQVPARDRVRRATCRRR